MLLVSLGQVAALFLFSARPDTIQPTTALKTRVHFRPASGAAAPSRDQIAGKLDPSLFGLVSARGFSGAAWLTISRFHYEMTNSLVPPLWLPSPIDELADDYDSFVQNNLRGDDSVSAKLDPFLSQVQVPTPVVVAATRIKLEGDLATCTLVVQDPAPVPSHPILTNSVVRVRVDSSGRTLSAALLSSCGVSTVDQQALRFAKEARYDLRARRIEAGPTNRLDAPIFGEVVFQWHRFRWGETAAIGAPRK